MRGGASRQTAGMKWRSYPSGKYRSYQPVLREGERGERDRGERGGRETDTERQRQRQIQRRERE